MAKLKVMGEIVESNTLLSHILMNSMHKTKWFDETLERRKNMSVEDIENETVEIKLTIAGEEIDPMDYFKHVENNFEEYVIEEARKLLHGKTTQKFEEMVEKIQNMNDLVHGMVDGVNLEYNKKSY